MEAGAGVIFGFFAALVFAVVEPQISQVVENKNKTEQKVKIPADEEETEEAGQENVEKENQDTSEENEQVSFSIDAL